MNSKVYFTRVNNDDTVPKIKEKFERLVGESRLLDFISENSKVIIKMHFGEEENTGYVRPEYVRVVSDVLTAKKTKPLLIDTNTLYRGRRTNSKEHLKLAAEHGFTKDIVGTAVDVPDDSQKENITSIDINYHFIKEAKIVKSFLEADVIISIAHFKGHIMTGFGGALKNIGMGCAAREGKLQQHSDLSPFIIRQNCSGCGECLKVCPVNAITLKDGKANLDNNICIGCSSCIAVCPSNAIEVDWASGGDTIQEKMIEHAKAVLKDKKNKSVFINFAIKITKECDCLAKDDPRIAPDTGIFISQDPVSIDKASWDMINNLCGKDIFKEAHPQRDGMKQLRYAARLGLGNLDYELVEIG